MPSSLLSTIVYHICNVATKILVGVFGRGRVVGLENVPMDGPLIVVSNHINWLDPPLVGAMLPRRVTFMAKDELFKTFFVGWVVKNYGSFPVRRGESDRQAMRAALRTLRAGGALGMFPEGHRSKTAQLLPGRSGAAVLAMMTGAPVLPIGITGTQNIRYLNVLSRPEFKMNVGRPFTLASKTSQVAMVSGRTSLGSKRKSDEERLPKEALAEALEEMMMHIAELLPQEYRGVYSSKSYAGKTS